MDYDRGSIEVAWLSDQSMVIKIQELGLGKILLMSTWHNEDLAHVGAARTLEGDSSVLELFSDVGAMAETPQWVVGAIQRAYSLYTNG